MRKLILVIIAITLFLGCQKKNFVTYSDTVFNPQNSFSRELKTKYTEELNNVSKKLGEFGLKVQQDGIGFTKGSTCKDCVTSPGDFWLFISLNYNNIDASKNVSLKVRAITVSDKLAKDTLFALKSINLKNLINDKQFKGFLVSGTYGIYKNIKEKFKPSVYETIDIYIPKDVFEKYVSNVISSDEILNFSAGYAAEIKSKTYQKIF